MNNQETQFFAADSRQKILSRFLSYLASASFGSALANEVAQILSVAIPLIIKNAEKFDNSCPENINWIGTELISGFQTIPQSKPGDSDRQLLLTFAFLYRFICEFEFSLGKDQELSLELRTVKTFVFENLDKFPEEVKGQLVFAEYLMPAQLLKKLINHPNMRAIKDFNNISEVADARREEWTAEIDGKKAEVDALKLALDEHKTGFNFVGLVKAFHALVDQKIKEKRFAFYSLVVMAIGVIAPPIYEVLTLQSGLESPGSLAKYLYSLAPLAALEIILIYFFRVILVHFRSIKAQLLQLELRSAMCQFIQSYSTYSAEIKKKDASALEKFESLIFSGLLTNEENLPATFDGTEQLAKLIKSVRG